MKSGVQQRYLEEVLGITLFPAGSGPAVRLELEKVPVTVECEDLTEFTTALLHKILSSVGLRKWSHMDIGGAEVPSHHRLRFTGQSGRQVEGGCVHWLLPTLSQMLGEGGEVATRKKSAWVLLQQFSRETARL